MLAISPSTPACNRCHICLVDGMPFAPLELPNVHKACSKLPTRSLANGNLAIARCKRRGSSIHAACNALTLCLGCRDEAWSACRVKAAACQDRRGRINRLLHSPWTSRGKGSSARARSASGDSISDSSSLSLPSSASCIAGSLSTCSLSASSYSHGMCLAMPACHAAHGGIALITVSTSALLITWNFPDRMKSMRIRLCSRNQA